ncbi:hypothetical protein BSZ19_35285 [Bradyrhizobium japonicum]|uniref:Uncharacterized protein n=1 Tax=Bradyrhizobium japonicum TaxID=375 RepID=A0A1Y2JFN1_BRAJP|nr:hypothetical protein BSZ19_35285 [Bradyrhizobium japonicum]
MGCEPVHLTARIVRDTDLSADIAGDKPTLEAGGPLRRHDAAKECAKRAIRHFERIAKWLYDLRIGLESARYQ